MAVTPEQATSKLEVILVYVVSMSQEGGNKDDLAFSIVNPKLWVAPIYLDVKGAEARKASLEKNSPDNKYKVVGISLAEILNIVEKERKYQQDKDPDFRLLAPVTTSADEMQIAKSLMEKSGLTKDQIKEGLNVPVFFTEPMMSMETTQGDKMAFFFEHSQLLEFIKSHAAIKLEDVEIKAADLNAILSSIISNEKDLFIFYPNKNYIEQFPGVIGKE